MSTAIQTTVPKTAAEVCQRFNPSDETKSLLREGVTPREFLNTLIEKQHFQDACRFLSHSIPKREAVWWACLCGRLVNGANPPPEVAAAQQAAEKWVVETSEENRRAAMPAAEAAQFKTVAGCAALAAFFSGGSLAPPNVPVVPPGEWLTSQVVAGAVMIAAVQTEPEKAPEKYRKYLSLGMEVANGQQRWK